MLQKHWSVDPVTVGKMTNWRMKERVKGCRAIETVVGLTC